MSKHSERHKKNDLIAWGSAGLASALILLLASSCVRMTGTAKRDLNADPNEDPVIPGAPTFKITRVKIEKAPTGPNYSTTVFFDAAIAGGASLTSLCDLAGKPCQCQFAWTETNTTSGSNLSVARNVRTNVTSIQSTLVGCNAPDAWGKEIMDGTTLRITVIAKEGNSSQFNVPAFSYTKGPPGKTYTFWDAQGRAYDNVLRYTCYEKIKRGLSVQSRVENVANPSNNTESVRVPMASHFCVRKYDGSIVGGQDRCEGLPPTDYTAQSYYYNLYIRDSENGDINTGNDRYTCPQVDGASMLHPSRNFYPLDTSFALAIGPSSDFPLGVEAYTKTSNGADPASVNSGCFTTGETDSSASGGSGDSQSLIKSCLGFAARPRSDASCPTFVDSAGNAKPTYRLRRYVAIYPPMYDTNGEPLADAQATDMVYVLDRPVNVSGRAANLPPYTMLGPKPCPFAYFDRRRVTQTPVASYQATNASAWSGKNVDGIELPNEDTANSCSAVISIPNDDMSVFSLGTVHASNPRYKNVYVRPQSAWSPHYVEDTDFQACAPVALNPRDPPLHFAKAGSNVAYCAEVFPSQNSRVTELDPPPMPGAAPSGQVVPFTSHAVKNSSSQACVARSLSTVPGASMPANYPSGGAAHHPNGLTVDGQNAAATCDRTVIREGVDWSFFPLLANATATERALQNDPSFACTVSWDNGTKVWTSTPSGGCCGSATSVVTGGAGAASAHLEPGTNGTACATPNY
jgi:hypothetical protein